MNEAYRDELMERIKEQAAIINKQGQTISDLMTQRDELLELCKDMLGPMIVWSQQWANSYNGGKQSSGHIKTIQRAQIAIAATKGTNE